MNEIPYNETLVPDARIPAFRDHALQIIRDMLNDYCSSNIGTNLKLDTSFQQLYEDSGHSQIDRDTFVSLVHPLIAYEYDREGSLGLSELRKLIQADQELKQLGSEINGGMNTIGDYIDFVTSKFCESLERKRSEAKELSSFAFELSPRNPVPSFSARSRFKLPRFMRVLHAKPPCTRPTGQSRLSTLVNQFNICATENAPGARLEFNSRGRVDEN